MENRKIPLLIVTDPWEAEFLLEVRRAFAEHKIPNISFGSIHARFADGLPLEIILELSHKRGKGNKGVGL